jgi:type I restriction enzyme S subunit
MSTSSYSGLRPSGIGWIGEVPDHWAVAPLFARYRVQLGKMLDERRIKGTHLAPYLRNVDVQWDRVNTVNLPEMDFLPDDRIRYLLIYEDLLICEGGEAGRTAMWNGELEECYYQKAIHRLRPLSSKECARYFFYVMFAAAKRGVFVAGGNPNTIDHLTAEKIRRHRFPFPPQEEQKAIADFLDRKTAQIEALVGKKQRQIELLHEKRQALILKVINEGLIPNVELKESGIDWLERVPSHWVVTALRRAARKGYKTFVDGDWIETPFITEDGVRLIQTGNVGIGVYKEQGHRYISEDTFHNLNCTQVIPGDVLICRLDGPVGRACIAPSLGCKMITSVDVTILKPDQCQDSRFLVYLLSSNPYLEWVASLCRVGGGFRLRVSRSMLGDFLIPLPPHEEQVMIADTLDRETMKLGHITKLLTRQIEKLHEYRQALITSAVTGKLDVRTVESVTGGVP